jgi:hypothetical protein
MYSLNKIRIFLAILHNFSIGNKISQVAYNSFKPQAQSVEKIVTIGREGDQVEEGVNATITQ